MAWWQTVPHDLLPGLKERLAATPHCHGKVKTTDTLGGLSPPCYHLKEKKKKSKADELESENLSKKHRSPSENPARLLYPLAISSDVIL